MDIPGKFKKHLEFLENEHDLDLPDVKLLSHLHIAQNLELMRMFKVMYEKAQYESRIAHFRSRVLEQEKNQGKHPKMARRESRFASNLQVANTISSTLDTGIKPGFTLPKLNT
jgi:hypothetical protein